MFRRNEKKKSGTSRVRRILVHVGRALLFAGVIGLIHWQHTQLTAKRVSQPFADVDIERLRKFFPEAESMVDSGAAHGGREVLDAAEKPLGYVLQTSPASDQIIGFSGPTNALIVFGPDDHIVGIDFLNSRDTKEHVAQVRQDAQFMQSFNGLSWNEAATRTDVDAVSGATLTSLAIEEAIIHRLGGGKPSLRFPDPVKPEDARRLFATAAKVEQDPMYPSLWHVKDKDGGELGTLLRTAPSADNIVGYQGPTEALIGFGPDGRVVRISLGKTYDNEQYVSYIRDDEYFLTLFNDRTLAELAKLDLKEAEVEGVSGATMSSMAVAQGLVQAADEQQRAANRPERPSEPLVSWTLRDLGTAGVILAGLIIGTTTLRAHKWVRIAFQLLLIGYLGLINGDMVSQAMLVGWAQNGIPWRTAGGLVLLTAAAFLLPLTTRKNIYCSHLCPHGAAQQLLKNRLPWRVHLPRRLMPLLKLIPAALLAWCVVVAMTRLPFSLVDIEPFDAWVFRIAGWATITIALVGLVASLFIPMAYCRYGCPTGALLNFLRYNSRSDRWTFSDWLAIGLVLLAAIIWLL